MEKGKLVKIFSLGDDFFEALVQKYPKKTYARHSHPSSSSSLNLNLEEKEKKNKDVNPLAIQEYNCIFFAL